MAINFYVQNDKNEYLALGLKNVISTRDVAFLESFVLKIVDDNQLLKVRKFLDEIKKFQSIKMNMYFFIL